MIMVKPPVKPNSSNVGGAIQLQLGKCYLENSISNPILCLRIASQFERHSERLLKSVIGSIYLKVN